jgi:hypothetical protein
MRCIPTEPRVAILPAPNDQWRRSRVPLNAKVVLLAAAALTQLVFAVPARADDYATLAASLASPIFRSLEAAQQGHHDTAVMLRLEIARQRLKSMIRVAPELATVRASALDYLDKCHSSMEEQRRLDGRMPDFADLAGKALRASPALVRRDPATGKLTQTDQRAVEEFVAKVAQEGVKLLINAWQSSTERETYRRNYAASRESGLRLIEIADRLCKGARPDIYGIGVVPKFTERAVLVDKVVPDGPAEQAGLLSGDEIVALDGSSLRLDRSNFYVKLQGQRGTIARLTLERDGKEKQLDVKRNLFIREAQLLDVDLGGSWDGTFDSDILYLRNQSGRELTGCTIAVTLEGDNDSPGRTRHLHYVDRWPAGQLRVGRYRVAKAKGISRDECVESLRRVTVKLYSDQYRNTIRYHYVDSGKMDADIARYMDQMRSKFSLTFAKDNFLSNASIRVTHNGGVGSFPIRLITARVQQGGIVKTVAFTPGGKRWSSGFLGGQTLTSEEFNGLDPDSIELLLEFPGSLHRTRLRWNFDRN